jgi:predicted esterase
MVGLHPFNTSRWNAETWCDTLIVFAESNGLIVVCPDGGTDGRVDDAIDTSFTTALIDSMITWYNIDQSNIFLMGFSWGGKTVYTYGLSNYSRFKGFMPIGAAIGGTSEVIAIGGNSKDKPWYLVHGFNDSPNTRYTPLLNMLNDSGACTNTNLMAGVGHTIDFPNRNQILTTAFVWLDTVTCKAPDTTATPVKQVLKPYAELEIHPNPARKGASFTVHNIDPELNFIQILDTSLRIINTYYPTKDKLRISTNKMVPGIYLVRVGGPRGERLIRISLN